MLKWSLDVFKYLNLEICFRTLTFPNKQLQMTSDFCCAVASLLVCVELCVS